MNKEETFSELYSRLYRENFVELEELRKKEKKTATLISVGIAGAILLSYINPFFLIIAIIGIIIYAFTQTKSKNNSVQKRDKSYREVFKVKVVSPIIEHCFEGAKYTPNEGISSYEYRMAGFKDYYDRYHSEDKIVAPLKVKEKVVTSICFSEVHTERESKDEDGHTTYTTIFRGLAGSLLMPKAIENSVYIRANGRVIGWNKNKVKMDMSEFEKMFDVESEDKILVMRILTSDVMTEMIDLYKKYKYKFEVSIVNDTLYMRLTTGTMFEPGVLKSSMEYKQIERYYTVLKALTSMAGHIYETIEKLEM